MEKKVKAPCEDTLALATLVAGILAGAGGRAYTDQSVVAKARQILKAIKDGK